MDADKNLLSQSDQKNVNIVRTDKNVEQMRPEIETPAKEPPDGGLRAILVMCSAFLCVGLLFGVLNTFSHFYVPIQEQLQRNGDPDSSSKASLVGSMAMGVTFLLSAISGILTDKIGLRLTTLIGGILCSSGLLIASFSQNNYPVLFFSYSIMYGTGAALTYTPSLAILGHYFKKYIGIVNGIVSSGSSLFTAGVPFILKYLIESNDNNISVPLRFLGIISGFIIICSLVYKPLLPPPKPAVTSRHKTKTSMIYKDNWRNKKYLIWLVSFPLALFGYFVPYIHIGKFIEQNFPENSKEMPIVCLGLASLVGRIGFGIIGDLPRANRVFMQQVSVILIGVSSMLIPLADSYIFILFCFIMMGLFDGCFISVIGPISIEICGAAGSTQAIGFLFAFCSIPLTVGPTIAGWLYDQSQSYTLPFILSGISPIFSAILMSGIHFVKDNKTVVVQSDVDPVNQPLAKIAWDAENGGDNHKPTNGHPNSTVSGGQNYSIN